MNIAILLVFLYVSLLIACMQLEYIENPPEETFEQTGSSSSLEHSSSSSEFEYSIPSSSSTSSSSQGFNLQIGEYELEFKGISYYEAILLCNKMSIENGLDTLYKYDEPIFTEDSLFWLPNIKVLENVYGYRLPTKEEWLFAMENGKIKKLNENVGEWLYSEVNSQYSIFELAPHFLKAVGLYREREGYPIYGIRVILISPS